MRKITMIVLHCSAIMPNQHQDIKNIDDYHKSKGWKGVGYHFYVRRDGTVERGRPIEEVGAHCVNHNRYSIGICYEGGLDAAGYPCDTRTRTQHESMRALLTRLHDQFPSAIIMGHRDLSPDLDGNGRIEPDEWIKQCPCFDALCDYYDLEPLGLLEE